jgi:hypothetical protein
LAGKDEIEGFAGGGLSRAGFLRLAGLGAGLSLVSGSLLPTPARAAVRPDILRPREPFPIVAWWPPPPVPKSPDAQAQTNALYAELAGAGFNAAIGGNGVANVRASMLALTACDANGLRFVVSDEELRRAIDGTTSTAGRVEQEEPQGVLQALTEPSGEFQAQAVGSREAISRRVAELANEFGREFDGLPEYPALAGISLHDEPGTSLFGNLRYAKEQVAQRFGTDELPHVNVWPSYASRRYALGAKGYQAYLERYMNERQYPNAVAPPLLSFDHYPLLAGGGTTQDFFYNHAVIRDFARRFNVPSWAFVQSMDFDGRRVNLEKRRRPDEAEIFWQINVALAYGVKGIQYFTYWTPQDNEVDFGNALIRRDGTRTPLYGHATRANAFLQKVGAVLLPLASTGVFHAGEKNLPRGAKRFGGNDLVEATAGDPTILGFFKGADARYMLVANRYPKKLTRTRLTIRRTVRRLDGFDPSAGPSGGFVPVGAGGDPPRFLRLSLGGGRSHLYRMRPA